MTSSSIERSDLNMETRKAGIELLTAVRLKRITTPFCLVSADSNLANYAPEARKHGANHVGPKHELMMPETAGKILRGLLGEKV